MRYPRAGALLLSLLLVWCANLMAEPRITVLTTDFVLEGQLRTLQEAAARQGIGLQYHRAGLADDEAVRDDLERADMLLVNAPRGNDMARIQQHWGEWLQSTDAAMLAIVGGQARVQSMDAGHGQELAAYYNNGTRPNFDGFFRYWAVHIGAIAEGEVPPPILFPEQGIYHPDMPDLVAATPGAYQQWRADRGLPGSDTQGGIGIIMSRSQFAGDHSRLIDTMIRRIEQRGLVPWMFYFDGDDPEGITRMVHEDGHTHVDVVINMTHLRGVTDRPRELAALGVPLMQGLVYRDGSRADWLADNTGMPMRMVPAFLAIPEQMGAQDTMVVAAVEEGEPVAIDAQLERLLDRASRLVQLRRSDPAEQRLALMYWSYPPGERGVSASNLNVPRSLARLFPALAEAGYAVESRDAATLETVLPSLLDPWQGRVDLEEWAAANPQHWAAVPVAGYREWFGQLPATVQARIRSRWGEPEADAMVLEENGEAHFVIPRLSLGSLVALPQPARSVGDTGLSSYHDGDLPPSHAYLAAYRFVRELHAADALIDFGTHGNQEFLSGKERALSVYDDASLVLGDLPVVYPYITDNIGEGLQARRRGQAVLVTHQTPPFAPAGLHGELLEVHDLIHEWEMLDTGPVRERTEEAIVAHVSDGTLYKDLGWELADIDGGHFEHFLHDLHMYLHELAIDAQPLGLHEFGSHPEDGHRVSTIMQMLGEDYYDALNLEEADELFIGDYTELQQSEPYRFLSRFLIEGESPESLDDPVLAEMMDQARAWDAAMTGNGEIEGLLTALRGRYLATTPGGDTLRNPDILPTGRNMFGFDPARLPTQRAWEVGQELARELLDSHRERHGDWPESLAMSLWSSEAMRHQGAMEAQMLHLLGLRPHWDRGGRLAGLDVIPAEELGRPRVDVVASITGVYRDQFPLFIEQLSRALQELARLEEPGNPISRHSRLLTERLLKQGLDAERAGQLAAIRVFSGQSGSYGTGVPDAVFDTEGWDEEEQIAEAYLARMQYGYGPGEGMWGVRLDDINLYAENLGRVQGAVLGRSSNLHGLLSTDHPFEYLGGIAMAVRSLGGESPDLYVSNLRNPGGERNVGAAQFMAGELRSRYQHPGWISAMQGEGYAGTLELLNVVNNFFGWQVSDPSMVRADQWQSFHDIYVQDSLDLGLDEWFETHNEQAMQRIVERMLETVRRDYWQPAEETLRQLVERHQELAGENGAPGRLGEYIDSLASGFGLSTGAAEAAQQVSGQRLTQVDNAASPAPPNLLPWLLLAMILGLVTLGSLGQWRRQYSEIRS